LAQPIVAEQNALATVDPKKIRMNLSLMKIAAAIVEQSDKDHPADRVLRDALARRKLTRSEAREITRGVFAYYRWHGWLDAHQPLPSRIAQARQLQSEWTRDPSTIADGEITSRAVPAWIGVQLDLTPAWARALQSEPPLFLRAKRGTSDDLARQLGDCQRGPLPDSLVYCGTKDLFRTPEFHSGQFEIQDINSQAVGLICDPKPGQTWWDACAGEGGKTLHLSSLMQNKGLIWATDRSTRRLELLKRRAGRAGVFNYRVAPWIGIDRLPTRTRFDGVLVDAPCSGVGTWHRNPHARWTTTLDDVLELAEIQQQLLARAAVSVKPGGKLIYAVCTLTKAETTDVTSRFERDFPMFAPMPLPSPFGGSTLARHLFWPQTHGGNGMFVAAWIRNEIQVTHRI
jgi:16S rRNA (cytosine967-C5)-methyltransferase